MNLSQTGFLLGELHRHLIVLIFASYNNAMSSVSCIKDLGVFIDCDLSFSKHIDGITRRAYQRTYMIYKGFVSRDKIMLSKAYTTYVRSFRILYSNLVTYLCH